MSNKFPNIAERIECFELLYEYKLDDDVVSIAKSSTMKEKLKQFKAHSLSYTEGNDIYGFSKEYPMIVYLCNEEVEMFPSRHLNAHVESITVSTVMHGKVYSVSKGRIKEKRSIDSDVAVYYTDNLGINHGVMQNDIFKLLLKKPQLMIATDGVLIFYTPKEVLVTTDLNHYAWDHNIDTDDAIIQSVTVLSDKIIVNLGKTEESETTEQYELNVVVDSFHGTINTKAKRRMILYEEEI